MKYLSQKHEDLSSIPTTHVKISGKVVRASSPRNKKVETRVVSSISLG